MGIRSGRDRRRRHLRKNITFAVAIDLARLLISTRSFRIALTRGVDEYVPLRERVARARALRADLLLERLLTGNALRAVSHMQSRLISGDTAAPDSAGSRKTNCLIG
jgi:hypothetical protein